MKFKFRIAGIVLGLAAASSAIPMCGCGDAGPNMLNGPPVTVMLGLQKITVSPDGEPVSELIFIASPSETAVVSFTGLPNGVSVKYAASDTSPSGTLTFMASSYSPAGSYTMKVTAMTAGQTASTTCTLVVEK